MGRKKPNSPRAGLSTGGKCGGFQKDINRMGLRNCLG